jgi:hypothetical protein
MATGSVQSTAAVAPIILPNTSAAYSDALLYQDLRTNAGIKPKKACWFQKSFSGGIRYGFCFLYENTKEYGTIVVFHYNSQPRYLKVAEGTPVLMNWATS